MDYKEKIWKLNSFGNEKNFYDRFSYTVSKGIEPEVIYNAYKSYLSWWEQEFGSREAKYIADKNKKVTPSIFLVKEMYNQSFKVTSKLSSYLKLDVIPIEDMERSYKEFLTKHKI